MSTKQADMNRSAILAQLGTRGSLSRADLASILGVSPALITQLVKDLLKEGLIREAGQSASSGGRPARQLELSADVGSAIGVKVAADHVVSVEVRIDGTVIRSVSEPFRAAERNAVSVLAQHVQKFIDDVPDRHVLGVGVGIPGTVADQEIGVVDSSQLGWSGVPLGRELRNALNLPVLVDNNVNAVALTQMLYGIGHGYENFIVVTIGTGIGASIILDGALRRGHEGWAGEIGHIPVDLDGPECHCGNRGCLEAFIGEEALLDQARAAGILGKTGTIEGLKQLADSGKSDAQGIYAAAGVTLGKALAGLVNTLGPEGVILLGEGVSSWSHWQVGFDTTFRQGLSRSMRSVALRVEDWNDDRWAQGGACLVLATPFDAQNVTGEQGRLVRQRLTVVNS